MRTEFEAFLTRKDERFLLYLDPFNLDLLYDSIGREHIRTISITYPEGGETIYKQVYDGSGEIPGIYQIIRENSTFDTLDVIKINDDIELTFTYWDDAHLVADWDTILKCIDGQKVNASDQQLEILNILPLSLDTYFFSKNDVLIEQKPMSEIELNTLLLNSYGRKVEELMLDDCFSEEDRQGLRTGLDLFEYGGIEAIEDEIEKQVTL